MDRRTFVQLAAAAGTALAAENPPKYKIVSKYKPSSTPGMPGKYPGRVTSVFSEKCIDAQTEAVDTPTVERMIAAGMTALTGDRDSRDSWARFFQADDVVGIKVNSSGAPGAMSMPQVVTDIARNLIAVGVKPENIIIHERSPQQMSYIGYEKFVPQGVRIESATEYLGFDPEVYVDCNFFGEDDTRSNLVRMVSEEFTKIINVPNMKDHGASGVTGCLKNIAYGEFNNVARSHYEAKTNTLTFIGTLASVEPLRSKTVLQVMDGLRGVWHAGPFSTNKKFRFYPKQMMFGTDPVAIDRLLIDIIEDKRKAEGAPSVWDQSQEHFTTDRKVWEQDPQFNRFIREPGHIEYATKFGLGVYDVKQIKREDIRL
jgi:uncharacterized protein (DUF362 family)